MDGAKVFWLGGIWGALFSLAITAAHIRDTLDRIAADIHVAATQETTR